MKILCVDDHNLFRQSLCRVLGDRLPQAEFWEAGSAAQALSICKRQVPDIILLDLDLGEERGIDVIAEFRKLQPGVRVLIVSMYRDPAHALSAIRAGVEGYVTKDLDVQDLVRAVGTVADGGTWFDPRILTAMDDRWQALGPRSAHHAGGGYTTLTGREQEVFLGLAEGSSIKRVAHQLGISVKTVENHRTSIHSKLKVADRYELVVLARQWGLII